MTLLLRLNTASAWLAGNGIEPSQLACLGPVLDKLRDEICDIDEKMLAGDIPTPPSKRPLETGFVRLPERMLAEYEAARNDSELGRMLAATKQLMTEVDRVVVLGNSECLSGPRALLRACCQPYFNELSRGERGSRPRMLFVGENLDNDEIQGLLSLLGAHHGREATSIDQRWGLVVIDRGIKPSKTACLLRPLLDALRSNSGGDAHQLQSRIVWVLGDTSSAQDEASHLGCVARFTFPRAVSDSFSVLSMAGLVPAALLGINIMKLLEGGRTVSEHFRAAKATDNLALQFAGMNHLMDHQRTVTPRGWCDWSRALNGMGGWYRHLLRGCLRKELLEIDLLSSELLSAIPRDEQNANNSRPLLHQIVVHKFRFDPLILEYSTRAHEPHEPHDSGMEVESARTLVEALHAARQQTDLALQASRWPNVELSMPQVDEPSVGQMLQLLMLSTVVEGRLMGRNPYN